MPEAAPKVFLSWSGDHAQTVAGLVQNWLTTAYQWIEVFYSPESIDKGDRPLKRIEEELEGCVAAIVVVTAESMQSPWVNYEVGALSALRLPDGRRRLVIPLLVGVERVTDISGPLTQFQAVPLNLTDFKLMVATLNRTLNMKPEWTDKILETSKTEIEAILNSKVIPDAKKAPERPERELLEDILVSVRNLSGNVIPTYQSSYPQSEVEKLKAIYGPVLEAADVYPWDYDIHMETDGSLIVTLDGDVTEKRARMVQESLEPLVEAKVYLKGMRIQALERKEGTSTI